jgi:cholesterol transport system auxiliary component
MIGMSMKLAIFPSAILRLAALLSAAMSALMLAACTLGPARDEWASYDFGAPPPAQAAVRLAKPLLVYDVVAPNWMDAPGVFYRLGYQDASRPRSYASSRWMMPAAHLLTNRLRQHFAAASRSGVLVPADGLRADHALRVEIEEFTQTFDAPDRSRAVIRARASLLGNRALVAQRSFSIERPAATPDAQGGVRALTAASDELILQILDWTAGNMK